MANETIQPDGWPMAKGYANGMRTENGMIFTGGQIGWTAQQVFETDDFIGQLEQTLRNIRDVVEAGGATVADIVRLTWYITDKREYVARQREVGQAYRAVMGRHFPAMAVVVVAGLIEDAALIEIEATAVVGAR